MGPQLSCVELLINRCVSERSDLFGLKHQSEGSQAIPHSNHLRDTPVLHVRPRQRIFRLPSAAKPPGLDVWENVSDDLPKVGGAQRPMLQVLTVSPGDTNTPQGHVTQKLSHLCVGVCVPVSLVDVLFGQAGV